MLKQLTATEWDTTITQVHTMCWV